MSKNIVLMINSQNKFENQISRWLVYIINCIEGTVREMHIITCDFDILLLWAKWIYCVEVYLDMRKLDKFILLAYLITFGTH